MSTPTNPRHAELQSLIQGFLSERLSAKLEKLADDDPRRDALLKQFEPDAWLEDAAKRVKQIQAVTHSLKPIHPDAKGSSLFCEPSALAGLQEVGSHVLGPMPDMDVVGNAAALDVYKFLKIEHNGKSLLSLAVDADADLGRAMSEDPTKAQLWMAAFAGLPEPRGVHSSHKHAKQVYWPIGSDPHDDAEYHLLAPLYPTSLIHSVYRRLQDDRFGEEAKAARHARKAGEWHERPIHEYPNLAVQQLGGTKPQNISQLNSERRGNNYLLASLPPIWRSLRIKPLFGVRSLLQVYRWRREVRLLTDQLRRFLGADPVGNLRTRERRDALVDALLEELIQFTAEVRQLDPGWSRDPRCELPPAQCAWLDPTSPDNAPIEPIDPLAGDFANWLNAQLRKPLPIGDPEYLHWRKLAREELRDYNAEVAHEH